MFIYLTNIIEYNCDNFIFLGKIFRYINNLLFIIFIMAVGLSGSNGGIGKKIKKITPKELNKISKKNGSSRIFR